MLCRIATLENSERLDLLPMTFFLDKLFQKTSFKPLIVKCFYLLRMSNDYCFRRVLHGQVSRCNRRNTTTVLRVVVKSHKGLKGHKSHKSKEMLNICR